MRRRSFSRGTTRRKRVDWGTAQATAVLGANSGGCAWILDPITAREFYVSPTILAIRSFVQFLFGSVSNNFGPGFVSCGIIRWDGVDDQPPVDCPLPLTDGNLDWMCRWVSPLPVGLAAGAVLSPNIFDITHLSKAKRKLENTAGLLWSVEYSNPIGTTTGVSIATDHRYLLQQV